MEDFYDTDPADADALRRAGRAGRRRRLHRVQVDGRARHDADRGLASRCAMPRPACGRCARRWATTSTSWSIATPGRRPRMGLMFAKALEPYRPLLVRRAVLAGERRWPGRDPARRRHADRHRRAAGRPACVSRAVRAAGLQRHSARHHALRRSERGAPHRRHGRGVSRRPRAAQSARTGEHGRVAGVRLCHAQLHHLRNGASATCPGGRTSCAKGSPSSPRAASCGPAQRPGLGIEINEAEVKKHPFQQEIVLREFYADGSVGDW